MGPPAVPMTGRPLGLAGCLKEGGPENPAHLALGPGQAPAAPVARLAWRGGELPCRTEARLAGRGVLALQGQAATQLGWLATNDVGHAQQRRGRLVTLAPLGRTLPGMQNPLFVCSAVSWSRSQMGPERRRRHVGLAHPEQRGVVVDGRRRCGGHRVHHGQLPVTVGHAGSGRGARTWRRAVGVQWSSRIPNVQSKRTRLGHAAFDVAGGE